MANQHLLDEVPKPFKVNSLFFPSLPVTHTFEMSGEGNLARHYVEPIGETLSNLGSGVAGGRIGRPKSIFHKGSKLCIPNA